MPVKEQEIAAAGVEFTHLRRIMRIVDQYWIVQIAEVIKRHETAPVVAANIVVDVPFEDEKCFGGIGYLVDVNRMSIVIIRRVIPRRNSGMVSNENKIRL